MIVVFGSINVDMIFTLDRLPAPGETVLGDAVRIEPGGKGANQAVAAVRDGAPVTMVGAIGRDALAGAATRLLTEAGVDCRRVIVAAEATGCAAICVDGAGRNQIAVGSGANLALREAQVEAALLGRATTLLLQMEVDPAETAALIRRARAAGTRIVLNLAPAAPLAEDALRSVDVLVVNEHEAAWLAGALGTDAEALPRALGITVVRTLGERGAICDGGEGRIEVPAMRVDAVDTTAAGDCFTGVLAAALERGLAMPAAMRRASVAAALCCTRAGSQASLPMRTETDAAELPLSR